MTTDTCNDGWIPLGTPGDLLNGQACLGLSVEGRKIGLFDVDGTLYALDDLCTHGNARLSEGDVDGFEVECPLHAGVFDVRTGKALTAPLTRDVRKHELKQEDGRLFIKLNR